MSDLKLIALDPDDLAVLSAHLQDSVLKTGDIRWLAEEKRLVVVLNRFVWEQVDGRRSRTFERRRSALSFARVERVRATRIVPGATDTVLELLAVRFIAGEAPSGTVELVFAGGGVLHAEVECLEAAMADLGAAWSTTHCPSHGEA